MSHNSINNVAAGDEQVLPSSESPRQRVLSDDDFQFQRSKTNTFKHVFCDYDISKFASTINTQMSSVSSHDMNAVTYIKDERWYDKSSAAYFTSKSTRNAQTVSLSQRHRPIFQMYLDL